MSRPIAAAVFATLAAVMAGVWWLHRSEAPMPDVGPAVPVQVPHKSKGALLSTSAKPATRPAVVEDSSWDEAFIKRIEDKYRYLMADPRLTPAQVVQLRELLLQREQLQDMAGPADDEDSQLDPAERSRIERAIAGIDARIRAVLDAAQYSRYEALRESDVEQQQLTEYSGGVSALAPLNAQQERLILEARLRHKKRFQAGLHDFGLDRSALSTEERLYAHRNVAQTLTEYRDNFLAEVRPALSEDQYFLLSSYESTEFARELERLQTLINSK